MVKIPSFSRAGTSPVQDEEARVDRHEETDVRRGVDRAMAERATAERAADMADNQRIAAEHSRLERSEEVGRTAEINRVAGIDRTADLERPAETDQTLQPRAERPAGRKARLSLLATASLIVGVAAAFFVLSGLLAGWGVALGVIAVLLASGGIIGTRHRHVAGKTDALIGLLLGLSAIAVGIVALTGTWSWLTADTDMVQRFREWLDTQFVDRF